MPIRQSSTPPTRGIGSQPILPPKKSKPRSRRASKPPPINIAEQGSWYTAIIRPLLALPVIIYFWKVIVWDKVLGLGSADPTTGMIADWTGMIVTAYVGGRSIEKVARTFAGRS
jgi:hypothetical protein